MIVKCRDFTQIKVGTVVSFENADTAPAGKEYTVIKKSFDEINFWNNGTLHKVYSHHWDSMGGFIICEKEP